MNNDLVAHSATILGTFNVVKSIDFYVNMLGFKLSFSWEEPPSYAVLKRGGTSIHLAERSEIEVSEHPIIYIFCNDIEAVYQEYKTNEIEIIDPLSTPSDYGMREFSIKDTNGYLIIFGSER